MNNINSDGTEKHIGDTKIKLLDVVALTEDVPEHNLKSGEVGTVVEILADGDAFEVEFSDDNGQMYKSLSFTENQLEVLPNEPLEANPKTTNKKLDILNDILKKYEKLDDHWENARQSLNNTFKNELEKIISSIENVHTSGEYLYRGENREYENVSSSMFRMTRSLVDLIEHQPRFVSEVHTLPLSYNIDDGKKEAAIRVSSINFNEINVYGIPPLPVHRQKLLENPDLLMESMEKEFELEFRSRANRVYELGESDIQSEIQHHLGKTRRVDMTKCPYIALFFACYGSGNHDGRLMYFSNDELKSFGELNYPKYANNTRFKNQESVLFIPKDGYIQPSKEKMILIPKHLKIPILLWLDKKKDISNRTMYNDTLGLIENQKILETYYDAYNKSITLTTDQTIDDYQKRINTLNEAIDFIPLIIDFAKNVKYNFAKPEQLKVKFSFATDTAGSTYIPAPYSLYLARALTRIDKPKSDKKVDNNEIKLALHDLRYARYMTQFSPFCINYYSDVICLHEGICYMLLGKFEKSKQKLSDALEICIKFETPFKDLIMFHYKQLEDYGF